MAEYIDKDSIVLDYSGLAKISPYDFMSIAEYFANQIKTKPAADVSPVRHGRWAWTQEVCEDDYSLNCSSCGSPCPGNYDDEDETYRYHRYRYYPNCGCKMDLEE